MKKLALVLATTIAMVSFAMPASARVTHHRVISQVPVTTVYYDPWGYGAYSAYAYYPYGATTIPGTTAAMRAVTPTGAAIGAGN
jgi:hypothetical protein